jgi:hypothetical protein
VARRGWAKVQRRSIGPIFRLSGSVTSTGRSGTIRSADIGATINLISVSVQKQISSVFYCLRPRSAKKRRLDATLRLLLEITIMLVMARSKTMFGGSSATGSQQSSRTDRAAAEIYYN